jgi:hypothetical protein
MVHGMPRVYDLGYTPGAGSCTAVCGRAVFDATAALRPGLALIRVELSNSSYAPQTQALWMSCHCRPTVLALYQSSI